jgi:GTP:adenosylcobinamide-phosphate guanylyltransferase
VKAVVTAGGRIGGEYARAAGTDVKALAMVRGKSMLDRVLDALRGTGATRIAVIGGSDVRSACERRVEKVIDEGATGEENVLRALTAWDDDGEPLLYATSDLPYVTAEAVDDFVRRAPQGAIAMALSEHADFLQRFAGAPPAGIELAHERVVNGGVFSLPPGSRDCIAGLATRFFSARKAPWRMATLVGPLALLRLATGRLSIAAIEFEAQRIVKLRCVAVRKCAPELAYDADTLDDYVYACENA